jgi:hypothetical protein
VLQRAKMLLNLTNNHHDSLIEYHLNSISQSILNFCNLPSLPIELEHIVINKAVRVLTPLLAAIEPSIPQAEVAEAKKIQRGDTTIEYTTETSILDDIRPQLYRFRKLRLN